VLALWRRDHPAQLWTDNPALADLVGLVGLVGRTFLRHWPVLSAHLRTLPQPRPARFTSDCDRSYRLRADTVEGASTLTAQWSAWQLPVRRPEHQHTDVTLQGRPLTASSVIAYCDPATITLNDHQLPGGANPDAGPTFVVLAESWSAVSDPAEDQTETPGAPRAERSTS
jgi:hypothetical protein